MQTKRRTLLVRALVAAGLVAVLIVPSSNGTGQPVTLIGPTSTTTTLAVVSSSTRESEWAKLEKAIKDAQLAQWYAAAAPPPPPPPKPKAPVAKNETPPQTYDSGSIESIIISHFGSIGQSAINVARCESTLNPNAVSRGGGNWGLFQINTVHRDAFESVTGQPWSNVLDADANAQFAAWLYNQSGGWGPWACRWAA